MIRLRPYKPCDAKYISGWLLDQQVYFYWGGYRFGEYPLDPNVMNEKYQLHNGDCAEPDNFYPFTAVSEEGPVGHFIIRYMQGDPKILRLGWVVVDSSKRGCGYGKEMLKLALEYCFRIMRADKVTIGVFEKNAVAYGCYRSVGFHESIDRKGSEETFNGMVYRIAELDITKEEYAERNPEYHI
ncbi:MAG: GNAT family N-acetyltransferase [Lachnospiraceae bacterium]|nr:GNAT family N-acetyltransferase [Lachnospiraceae bacterium]